MNLELKVEDKLKEENISNLTQNSKEVTDEKIEKSLNYDELSESEKKAVDEFITKIDVMDQNLVLQYGAKAQNKISAFSDNILEDVKTKDIGDTGELLANLVGEIKSFNSSIGTSKKGIFKLFNSAKKEISTIIAKYNKIEKNVDTIENSLEKNKLTLLKYNFKVHGRIKAREKSFDFSLAF